MRAPPLFRRSTVAAALAGLAVLSAGCGDDSSALTGSVRVAGSTTLLPLIGRATEAFAAENLLAPVNVRMTGTTDGITLLCDHLADIAGASRPITVRELRGCATAGVHPTQVTVTRDAVVLFTDTRGHAPACLALGDLYQRFASGMAGTQPPVVVPDASSGTRTMFLDKVVAPLATRAGVDPAIRRDAHVASSDQQMLAEVLRVPEAIGLAGWQTVRPWLDKVRVIAVNAGDGCVAPSASSIASGTYPLSRDLLVYANPDAGVSSDTVVAYMDLLTSPDFLTTADTGLSADDLAATEHAWATRAPAEAAS
ncbi:MAG: substrate-binding domain-containing protein [Thermoleophilia bacterium]